jgi:hypothetical protein
VLVSLPVGRWGGLDFFLYRCCGKWCGSGSEKD